MMPMSSTVEFTRTDVRNNPLYYTAVRYT